jgi:hypothetical protein
MLQQAGYVISVNLRSSAVKLFAPFVLFCGKKSVSIGVHPWFPSPLSFSLRFDATRKLFLPA